MKNIDLAIAQRMYESGKTLKEVGVYFNVSDETIRCRFKKAGIKIKSKNDAKRIYELDETFFSKIDDEFKSYFLGFIYSDGWVHKNVMALQLAEQDKEILLKFQKCLKTEKPLILKKQKKITHQNQYTLKVSSDRIVSDLSKLGVSQNKTHTVIFRDDIFEDDNLIKHFIRGVFDGDGTTNKAYFSIVGTERFLIGIKEHLKKSDINLSLYDAHCKSRDIKRLAFNNRKEMRKIFHYLYDNSNIYLTRKRDKFLEYFKNLEKNDSM